MDPRVRGDDGNERNATFLSGILDILMALLEIEGLTVEFGTESAPFVAVDDVDLTLDAGEILGCVGESGSGKSVTALAVMGLIDFQGRVPPNAIRFSGR